MSAMMGAMRIALTSRGQMATAVMVVLLAWAVLTQRVYVVKWKVVEPPQEEELPRTPSPRVASQRAVPQRPLKPNELMSAAGQPTRVNNRLVNRPGAYWSEPEPVFKVRGPSYLMDKVKIMSPKPVFQLLDCDLFELPAPTTHLARHLQHRISGLWSELPTKNPYTFVIQLQVPGPPHRAFVMYFGTDRSVFDEETPFSRIARRFFSCVDTPGSPALHKWRNNTFKLIPRCVNAPFVVKRAVGDVPTLLGNKLQQFYFGRDDYFEVDVNISSSRIAQYTVGLALNSAAVVVCDLAFVLQGASPAELPEVVAACMRIEHIVMKDATILDIPIDDSSD